MHRSKSTWWLAISTLAIVTVLVIAPLSGLVATTLRAENIHHWGDVFNSALSENLLWRPLLNSIVLGIGTALLSTLVGGFLAWVVVMTNIPGRKAIGFLAMIPFALPSFALALAWESTFRNNLIGGSQGLIANLGIAVPDWLAWGPFPIVLTLTAHYYSLSYMLIAAALANVKGDLLDAANLTGASPFRVARSIALPIVTPAVLSGALLAFAEGVSNFVTPAILGLPVRYNTLSTRLYGAISTGDINRGYILSIVLIVVSAAILFASTRATTGRRNFDTITGKGARSHVVQLGVWSVPIGGLAWLIVVATTIIPGLILFLSTLARHTNSLEGGLTWHYWIGESDPAFSQGMPGVFNNPQIVRATTNTLLLGLAVAIGATILGLAIAYVLTRFKPESRVGRVINTALNFFSFVPFLIPGIAFGAAYIAQFGISFGPIPSLYGTVWILILAGIAATLPFAVRTGVSAMSQISTDIEESAFMTGASLRQRMGSIIVPLTSRGLFTGAVLVFVQTVRDLSLVVLLVTPAFPLLAVLTFQYSSENFTQLANAITVIIAAVSVVVNLLATHLENSASKWAQRN